MKIGKVEMVLAMMLLFNMYYCSAWFGNRHKSGRNSILPTQATSSSCPRLLNPAGSYVVIPLHGNVYPVG